MKTTQHASRPFFSRSDGLSCSLKSLMLFLFTALFSQISFAQSPCNAHRWTDGDGWRFTSGQWVPTTTSQPSDQPKGIVRCASSAETESGLTAFKGSYNPSVFAINTTLTNCFNQQTGDRGVQVSGPTNGEDIVWFNFDIRPLAGTTSFRS